MRVGDIRTIKQILKWRECEGCGKPAKYRLTFLLKHFRRNPSSTAYGKDDCSWCSDLDVFSCERCKHTLTQAPSGYEPECCISPLKRFKHIAFYWQEQ